MSEGLTPCFFCECDEARVIVVDEVTDAGAEEATVPLYAASCPYCGASGPMALSEDEAVEAWNRRAERTCRVVSAKECGGVGYAPGCSECGWQMAGSMWHNYCPNCGARVVSK